MPTSASRDPMVMEANKIVGQEAFKMMGKAKRRGNAKAYEAAQDFLTGRPKPRTR